MNTYAVTFDFADYICEYVRVYADNKTQVRRIMRDQYGKEVKIRDIEQLD